MWRSYARFVGFHPNKKLGAPGFPGCSAEHWPHGRMGLHWPAQAAWCSDRDRWLPKEQEDGQDSEPLPRRRTGSSALFLPQFTSRFFSHWALQTRGVFLQTDLVPSAVQLLTCSVCFTVLLRFVSLTSNFQNIWGQEKCGFTGM